MTDFTIIKIRLLGSQLFFTWSTDDWQEEPQANQGPRQTMGRRQINQKPAVGSIDKGPHPTIHAFTHFRLMFYSYWDEALCRARLACPKDTTCAAGCHCSHVVYVLASLEHALLLHQATYSRDSVCENKGRGHRFNYWEFLCMHCAHVWNLCTLTDFGEWQHPRQPPSRRASLSPSHGSSAPL